MTPMRPIRVSVRQRTALVSNVETSEPPRWLNLVSLIDFRWRRHDYGCFSVFLLRRRASTESEPRISFRSEIRAVLKLDFSDNIAAGARRTAGRKTRAQSLGDMRWLVGEVGMRARASHWYRTKSIVQVELFCRWVVFLAQRYVLEQGRGQRRLCGEGEEGDERH